MSIRDVVLIDALDIDFAPGLNVLTGETGAGKSILLDALGLTLGAKAGPHLVRPGAQRGVAAAAFLVPPDHPAAYRLAELGIGDAGAIEGREPFELILRRVVPVDGRARAFVDDQPVGLATLRALGADLVDIHGQGEDRAVSDARGRRAALDAYAGIGDAVSDLRRRHAAWREAAAKADSVAASLSKADADRDFLAHAVSELSDAAPTSGEETRLEAERRRLKAAERIAGAVDDAARAAAAAGGSGALGAAARRLARALDRLEIGEADLADDDRAALDAALAALDQCLESVEAAAGAVSAAAERFAPDADALEAAEARLFQLRALARKHRVTMDDLPALAERLSADLATLEDGAARQAAAEAAAARAAALYREAARAISTRREAAAAAFDAEIARELPDLRLARAAFRTQVSPSDDPADAGPEGVDRVAFLAAFNPGAAPAPVEKTASGGELSRLLLALKVALAQPGSASLGPILVFDEIDRGVGGAAADAVGRRLQRLALAGGGRAPDDPPRGQAIVVTHAPQIAARADRHWRIEKRVVAEQETRTDVTQLDPEARREEVARMLAGAEVTDAARAAAADLIGAAAP
ncbi:MAG: DNA repair protein RecN [Pseudomonadota bacterium]